MPHADRSVLTAPTIEPLRSQIRGRVDQISKNTLIQISTENALHKIYFTTDGSRPDAFNRTVGGREVTHKYRAPFGLKSGPRTIRAVAYTRNGKQKSDVSTRTFEVLKSDTELSQIGEEDEDSLSSILSPKLTVSGALARNISSISEGNDVPKGKARYMERLRRHLDEGIATPSDSSDLDFETPRSIREMLNEIETPHTARKGRNALREVNETDLSSSEWERLRELEEKHRFERNDEELLAGQALDEFRRQEEAYRQERERAAGCADCKCDDGAGHIADFFCTPTDRLLNSYDQERRHSGGQLSNRSNVTGSGHLSDEDYGITGVTRRVNDTEMSSHRRQGDPISENLFYGTTNMIDAAYRWQVDSELVDQMRASRDRHGVLNGTSDCAECCVPACCTQSCTVAGCEGDAPRNYFPNTPRYEEASLSHEHPERRRSRERMVQGILKRGRSLERARSHERERGRQSRSRSHSAERRLNLERSPRRSRSRSPGSRYERDIMQLIDIETLEENARRTRRKEEEQQRQQEECEIRRHQQNAISRQLREQNGDIPQHRPSRSRQPKVRDLRDTELSLEELDTRLSQFEDSDSAAIPGSVETRQFNERARQTATALKKRKDSANMKKSGVAKKKPIGKLPSPPLSTVSSTLSSSSSSSSSTSSSEKEVEKEDSQEKNGVSGARVANQVIVPKVHTLDKQNGGPQNPGKKMGKGALNFFNDSGTQINFWGVSPDEIAQRLREDPSMKSAMDAVHAATQLPPTEQTVTEEESEYDDAVDQFFITEPRRGQPAVKVTRQAQAFSENYADEDDFVVQPVSSGDAHSAPVMQSQQQEQHNFLGTIGEKVKGFFSGKKSGPKDLVQVNYEEVKKKCRKSKKLWEDPYFPAEDSSLFHTDAPATHPFQWKRPHEICKDPQYIVDGASRFDVKQGVLGNCWFLAAVASLAGQEPMLHRVIIPDQSFHKGYAGIFHFQFWQYGEWIEVCVDDRLPTKGGKLTYMHSVQQNEFWSPLLEKAYAKLNGCYENLSGGLTSEALTDFTGGLIEFFNFREELPDNMFQILNKAFARGSLMGCSIDAAGNAMEQQLDSGLIIGHAYSITDIKQFSGNVSGKRGQVQLVRVRNPWGNHCEWNGAWSDSSNEWQSLPEKVKKKLGITTSHDGEFWMSIRDFTTHFQRVEICNQDRAGSGAWESRFVTNAWVKNVNAGGCRNFPETYPTNPQFHVAVTDIDDDDDEQIGTVIIALMQKARRKLRPSGGGNLTIGYDIFETGSNTKDTLDRKFFRKNSPVATSPQYINTREVTGRHRLPPGNYCIVPTSFECNEEAEFLMRIYSEKEAGLVESDVTTTVNAKIAAKTMSVAHSAPGQKRKSQDAEKEFRAWAGEDLELDADELLNILNATFTKDNGFGSFNTNNCRSMLAIRDTDATGMLGLEEFKSLWDDLIMWKQVFLEHDKDASGFFSSFELREALKAVGYTVSNLTFKNIVTRYAGHDGHIQFNDFIDCLVRIKTLFELHGRMTQDGTSTSPLDSFVQKLVYM